MGRPGRRLSQQAIAQRSTSIGFRLRTLIGKLGKAFFEFGGAVLQAVGLAFGGVFCASLGVGLSLRLRVCFRRAGRAASVTVIRGVMCSACGWR